MSNHTYFLIVCNRLHLIKFRLCCFLDMHLYSNSLSTIAMISSLYISELFLTCPSCSNNFTLLRSSLGSDGKNIVFEIPEAEIIKPGDLSNFTSVLSQVVLLSGAFTSKYISFAKSNFNFLSNKLARS